MVVMELYGGGVSLPGAQGTFAYGGMELTRALRGAYGRGEYWGPDECTGTLCTGVHVQICWIGSPFKGQISRAVIVAQMYQL